MPSTKAIRTRIKAVKNTAQITRAMQLVAASKMKRAQDSALAGRSYAVLMAEILASLIHHTENLKHPLLEQREVKTRGILVISTDKGLCGALNANLFKQIIAIKDKAAYVSIGRKGTQFLSRTKRDLLADFPLSDHVRFSEIRTVVEFMIQAYLDGKIDTIEVLYTRYVNTLVQEAQLLNLVPLSSLSHELEELKKRLKIELAEDPNDEREMIFEPSAAEILNELPALFIKQAIYQVSLEAKASEHSARMVAMKAATDNAKNLVEDLSLEYNKARQAAITQEILELAAASAANQ